MENIKLNCITKSFDGKKILDNFSTSVGMNEITALTAPSGKGKTTLLRIIAGLEKADSGNLEGLSGLKISAVFQEDRLLENLTSFGNIKLACPKCSKEKIYKALDAFGLKGSEEKKAEELSGGMKRRTAILRALLSDYDLLLMDEPFRGLDDETKEQVMIETLKMCAGKTVIFVTHDKREIEFMKIKNIIEL